ncbi:MAG: glycosyltransferase family 2 protein [Clostridiales Family XIII bacterium]|jgi:glycosyltransferase involved in cell wall biosynthesis|nr:glycosyltransferase family 2 protein [Clostridiales Family XIII bacterium]
MNNTNNQNGALVSVVMPCYNDGDYILESIESVKRQKYSNIELIIVDDGSTDEKTVDILDSIDEDNIAVYRIENSGPSKARNYAISQSRGAYILPLDADDLIDSTYIEKAVSVLEKNSSVGVVYCKADSFGSKDRSWTIPDYSFEKMIVDNIVFVTAVFRKSDWEAVGGFCTDFHNGMEDYDFWLSILETEKTILQIPETLFHYRLKETSRTTNFIEDQDKVNETYRQLYLRHKDFFHMHYDEYAILLRKAFIDIHFDMFLLQAKVEEYRRAYEHMEKFKKIPGLMPLYSLFLKLFRGK